MHSANLAANPKFPILKKRRRNKKGRKPNCDWSVYSGDLFLVYITRNILDFLWLIIGFLGINEKLFYMNRVKLLVLANIKMRKSSIITLSNFLNLPKHMSFILFFIGGNRKLLFRYFHRWNQLEDLSPRLCFAPGKLFKKHVEYYGFCCRCYGVSKIILILTICHKVIEVILLKFYASKIIKRWWIGEY